MGLRPAQVQASLEASGLPEPAVSVLRELIGDCRLWKSEQQDVLDELISHFEEGLASGKSVETLVAEFGPPKETAPLIRTAKRRGRSIAWKAAYATALSVAVVVGLAAATYLSRAASLYLRPSASGASMSAEAVVPATEQIADRWAIDTRRVRETTEAIDELEKTAREALTVGRQEGLQASVERMLVLAGELRQVGTVDGELSAARVELTAATLLTDAIASGTIELTPAAAAKMTAAIDQPVRLTAVRDAFTALLDFMYTGDGMGGGHLTAAGIEMLRRLKDWHEPTLVDRLMEPVWYALPASRAAVHARFEEVACIAELGGPARLASSASVLPQLEPIRKSMWECLRFPAFSAVLPQLASVLYANEKANRAKAMAVFALRNNASPSG